jgi:hypothetical protein
MLDLVIRFESIDNFVQHELDNPHKLRRNDEDLLGPVSYREADKNEFATLVKEHDQNEVLTYLGDLSQALPVHTLGTCRLADQPLASRPLL